MLHVQSASWALLLTSLFPSTLAAFNSACPAEITHANATGTVLFNDPITQGTTTSDEKAYTDDTSYLLSNDTILGTTSNTNLSYTLSVSSTQTTFNNQKLPAILSVLSVNTDSINLFDQQNSFAACALPILNLPSLTTRYGQSDTGNCEATIPYGCIDKILERVLATKFTYGGGDGAFANICAGIGDSLALSLNKGGSESSAPEIPEECRNLFHESNSASGDFVSKVKGYPITSNNDTTPLVPLLPYQCSSASPQLSADQVKSYPFWNVSTQYNADGTIASEGSYDEAVRRIYPVVTVFFRGLQHTYFQYLPPVSASMSCVRVNEFSQGSRVSAPLGEVKPPNNGLSTGIKAGIAVVVVVAVLIALGLLWAFWWRKRPQGQRKDYGQPKWWEFRKRAGGKDMGAEDKYEMMH